MSKAHYTIETLSPTLRGDLKYMSAFTARLKIDATEPRGLFINSASGVIMILNHPDHKSFDSWDREANPKFFDVRYVNLSITVLPEYDEEE